MEVKIKQGNEMLDATIEMVDGVMVVSPKVEYVPKDGDVVFQKGVLEWIFIYKDCCTVEAYEYVSLKLSENKLYFSDGGHIGYINTLIPATEEEKKLLFDKLAEEGYEWKPDTKELIKLKWKPSMYDPYYIPFYETCEFVTIRTNWNGTNKDDIRHNKGLCFKTKEECQEFCNRLNNAINSVKP